MRCRFIHAADIHLGHVQYNLELRADDFARSYFELVDYVVSVRADFLLVAGDLFHHARADAWSLKQAIIGLERLQRAGIPTVAIQGNHDVQHYHRNLSWMQFLCDQELLILLDLTVGTNNYRQYEPFNAETRRGGWIDLAGVRIYGLKYSGAATARILEEVHSQIEPGPAGYTVMALHAGMQGQVPHLHGGLTLAQLEPFRSAVDYFALGHVHKRLREGNWIFNPGSTDTNSIEEMDWAHGFFDVEVDTTAEIKQAVTPVEIRGLRPFRRILVTAGGSESLTEFVAMVEQRIAEAPAIPEGAVIELRLGGVAAFRRQDLPLERLKEMVETRFAPLLVRVQNSLVPPGVVSVQNRERLLRVDLERQVVDQLVYQHAEYRDRAEAWTRLILDVKNMAAEQSLPASIVDHLRRELSRLDDGEEAMGRESAAVESPSITGLPVAPDA